MASSYTSLGVELQVTGENAGTWGDKTNTNLQLLQQLVGGFNQTSTAGGAGTTALDVVDGNTTGTAQQNMIELTGTITGNRVVTIPIDIERMYIIRNSTSGAFTVEFKYASGSGSSVTFAATDKGTRLLYAKADDVTNPNIIDVGMVDTSGIQTLTNKTLTSPAIGTSILDTGGNELFKLTATGSATNELTVANAANGSAPSISATGSSDSNVNLDLTPKGLGAVKFTSLGSIAALQERATVAATGTTGTVNFDVLTQAVLFHTTNAAGNFTVNFRGDGSNTLNNTMNTNDSMTVAFLVTNGSTPYYNNAVTIDGSSVTPEYQGGSAPSAGNASSIDVYTYTIIKTGSAAFTVLAAQTQFA
jgi:hypothetical protein